MLSPLPAQSKIGNRKSKIPFLLWLLLLAGGIWLCYEIARSAESYRVLNPGTPEEVLLITPGRAMAVLYAILVALTLIPLLYLATALRLPALSHERRLFRILLVAGMCASIMLAGFAWESLRTEVRLSGGGLEYRQGALRTRMGWPEIRQMALRQRGRRLELTGRSRVVRIDLSAFSIPDRVVLIRQVLRISQLSLAPVRRESDPVWRRAMPHILPTP